MSTLVSTEDSLLARDVVTHLDEQLVAARRLLQIVLGAGRRDPRARGPDRRLADGRASG